MNLFRCCSSAIRRINCGIAAVAERTQQTVGITDDVIGSRRYKVFCETTETADIEYTAVNVLHTAWSL